NHLFQMRVTAVSSFICLLLCSFNLLGQSTASTCVLLKNEHNAIPIVNLQQAHIAFVNLSDQSLDAFQSTIEKYTKIDILKDSNYNSSTLQGYNYIIYTLSGQNINWKLLYTLTELAPQSRNIAVSFETFEHYSFNDYLFDSDVLVQLKDNTIANQLMAASLIFGGSDCTGSLENPISTIFNKGSGLKIKEPIRLGYALPENEGLDSDFINKKVDSIINRAIKEQAFPGAQLLVAKNNSIIYHKS